LLHKACWLVLGSSFLFTAKNNELLHSYYELLNQLSVEPHYEGYSCELLCACFYADNVCWEASAENLCGLDLIGWLLFSEQIFF